MAGLKPGRCMPLESPRAARKEANLTLGAALEIEAATQARCMNTADCVEGYNAFVEKRPLQFNRS